MGWAIEAAVAPKIGFATHQNAIPVLRSLAITAAAVGGDGLCLSLVADPPFVRSRTWRIDAIGAGETMGVADRDVVPDAAMLRELTESVVGTLTLTLAETAPAYARRAEVAPEPVAGDRYRATDFAAMAAAIDPERFYDPRYDETLVSLVAHVLAAEAPIAETLLVQRIARAHGFQRAGRVIRDRVMALVARRHDIEQEPGGDRFVWRDAASRAAWDRARYPATDRDVRPIEDVALAELRIARDECRQDAIEAARRLGIRRLSASARARIEQA